MSDSEISIERVVLCSSMELNLSTEQRTHPAGCEVHFLLSVASNGAVARVTLATQLAAPPPVAGVDIGHYMIGYLRGLLTNHYTVDHTGAPAMQRGLEAALQKTS